MFYSRMFHSYVGGQHDRARKARRVKKKPNSMRRIYGFSGSLDELNLKSQGLHWWLPLSRDGAMALLDLRGLCHGKSRHWGQP